MKNSVAVKATCEKCRGDIPISGGTNVGDKWMIVIPMCPSCHPKDGKKPKKREMKENDPSKYIYGDRSR